MERAVDAYLLDCANLLLRWLHVVAAIAWIGSSFYFVFLDSSLTPPVDERLRRDGATGELWAVHGGGFYHPVKYAVAPPRLPERLHWFYWESYTTWLSGFALLAVSYLWQADIYLVDARVYAWPAAWMAGAAGDMLVAHVEPAQVLAVVQQRCVPCHGEALASKGVRLDSAQALAQQALIAAWWRAGAPVP